MKKVELLAPARDYECGVAAVDFGADAIYIGGPAFGARAAAGNSCEEVKRLTDYAHRFGVRVYATLNTLLYENELRSAELTARELIEAGVDALIVQDMAFARMGLEGVELHASTQMSNTSPEEIKFLQECGFSRVVLERGLTLDQIKQIRQVTDVPLESFVHGAICVGTSGKCYLSRSMGKRSGNRGECSQPCRLPYDLVDMAGRVIIGQKHLLSVKDMDFSHRIGDLLDAGVTSFKIEGRLKDVGYVKNTVGYYRQVIDRELAKRKGLKRSSSGVTTMDFKPDPAKSFMRGATEYFLGGKKAGVASFDTPKAVGIAVGRVDKVGSEWFTVEGGVNDLAAADGICFFWGGELAGTNINKVESTRIYPNRIDGLQHGVKIFRNFDHRFAKALDQSRTERKIEVSARVIVQQDSLIFIVTDSDGTKASAQVSGPFEEATDTMKMEDSLRKQLTKSGDTIFFVKGLKIDRSESTNMPFVAVSILNGLRREALDALIDSRVLALEKPATRVENMSYPHPEKHLGGEANVTNSLAETLYRDHGVETIERGYDLEDKMATHTVMVTPYCIRREIGECLRERTKLRCDLYINRGKKRYRLDFDCKQCVMKVVDI